MERLRKLFTQPWPLALLAGFLIAAIALAGSVGLLKNLYVKALTEGTLGYAIELQDESNQFRAAVFDMRQFHRDEYFRGASGNGTGEFDRAYERLQGRLDQLEELGVRDPEEPQPEMLRGMAEDYYLEFRPALGLYDEDPQAFREASDRALDKLGELEAVANEIDELSARDASEALENVEQAENSERIVLVSVAVGLILALIALAYTGIRMIRMVAELRKLHTDQRAAAEALAAASRTKTDFLTDVSHELRTPLTVLRSNAEFGMAIDPDWTHADLLKDIVNESVHMSAMIEDLLFLARSDSASLPIERREVDISLLMAELSGRAEVLARERGAGFVTQLEGEGRLEVDPARFEQAILILVDNAAKHGSSDAPVTLVSKVEDGELKVSVKDKGQGIPVGDLPLIFDRFFQVGKARSRYRGSGSGLGLSIARTIAELHGGRIEAESKVGEGTKMTLRLPLSRVASAPGSKSAVS